MFLQTHKLENVSGLPNSFESKMSKSWSPHLLLITVLSIFFFQDRVYVQQNGVDNVYNLGLILFRDLVSFLLIYFLIDF